MTEFIGWLAGILFAFCALPQAIESKKRGNSDGLSSIFLWTWLSGEMLMIIYVVSKYGLDGPLLFNYNMNLLFLLIIIKYKYFPRR